MLAPAASPPEAAAAPLVLFALLVDMLVRMTSSTTPPLPKLEGSSPVPLMWGLWGLEEADDDEDEEEDDEEDEVGR